MTVINRAATASIEYKARPTTREDLASSPARQLRNLIESGTLEFILEAHSALSAKIVEEAGHRGIWASGLSMSAAMGVRDNNEVSWTQVLDLLEFMSDAVQIPILLDGDTGYGNFNNVRRLIRKLEQRCIAGVCLEDKMFPKTNSFIDQPLNALAPMDEFCGKIKAAKDTQQDGDFCVVARVEALIAGCGMAEALKRADAYREAGADAILIHSKQRTPDEILGFMDEWAGRGPVIIVPTTYYSTPTQVFADAGVSLIIWANHMLRTSIKAMQETAKQIFEEQTLRNIEDEIVPVKEVFRLQGASELQEAEKVYLPKHGTANPTAIVLAASRGTELGALTDDRPKTMINVRGKPLLTELVEHFKENGVSDIHVVTGYKSEAVEVPGIKKIENPEFAETRELYSLNKARHVLADCSPGGVVISFGDILFRRYMLQAILDEDADIAIAVDSGSIGRETVNRYTDLVRCSRANTRLYDKAPVNLVEANPDLDPDKAHGEWIGLMRVSDQGAAAVCETLDELSGRKDFNALRMNDLFNELLRRGHEIRVVYFQGQWFDVDDLEALSEAIGS